MNLQNCTLAHSPSALDLVDSGAITGPTCLPLTGNWRASSSSRAHFFIARRRRMKLDH
jgi:hypothetical protein